jgi:flagellar biosynthetic protein FliR
MRMSGLFIFNPILGRENIPLILRTGLGFICTLSVVIRNLVELVIMSLGELFIGLAVGIVISILLYVVQLSGELIDMQLGLTMAKMYDAHTGVNMPLFGSFFNLVMLLCFFASNAHISLVKFLTDSFLLIPPGTVVPTTASMQYVVSLGTDYFELGLRLAMPIVAIEIVAQIGIGLLMKAVPAINVFTIGMHVTALIGIVLIVVTMTSIFTSCGQLVTYMIEKVTKVIRLIGTGT